MFNSFFRNPKALGEDMPTETFRFTREGDKVWDVRYGWGIVSHVKFAPPHGNYHLVAKFPNESGNIERTFWLDGIDIEGKNQTLFLKEMKS